jgi:lysozyme family protein
MALGMVLGMLLGLCTGARGAVPDQEARWNTARLESKEFIRLERCYTLFKRNEPIYRALEAMNANGVPASVIFALHYRESDNSFTSHLHEGSSLLHRTRYVPKGRIPGIEPPYTFLVSARDALYDYEHLETRDWRRLAPALQAIESYNGLGYQKRGVVSPYLWSGTSVYTGGKYVADGRFSPTARDAQLGVVAILRHFSARGIRTGFEAP